MPRNPEPTRRRILDAAYELFYRMGFGRVGVDEVAARAGVTKRTLYYHFKSKDELLSAVLEFHHQLALARVQKYADRYSGSCGRNTHSAVQGTRHDGRQSPGGPEPDSPGSPWNLQICRATRLEPSRIATRVRSKRGGQVFSKRRACRSQRNGRARWRSSLRGPRR